MISFYIFSLNPLIDIFIVGIFVFVTCLFISVMISLSRQFKF